MYYVLTTAGSSEGWGQPIAIFDDKLKLKSFIKDKNKEDFYTTKWNITTNRKIGGGVEIRVMGYDDNDNDSNDCAGIADYEVFEIEYLNGVRKIELKFDFFEGSE